jgi:PST family polysaccharide transporter
MHETRSVAPSSGASARGERATLDRSLLHGIAWTGGIKWLTQLLSWASTLIVARILTPADYGLVGMATVYLGFVQLVNEFGLTAAVIQRRDLDEDQIARIGGLSALLGAAFLALSVALSGPVAHFFGESDVRWIVVTLSLTFVTTGFQVLPRSLLTRDLEFRKIAWIDGVEALVLTASTLLLAVAGFRYWALVIGAVLSKGVSTLLAIFTRPHRLAWPSRFRSIAGAVTFGWHLVVSRTSWYAYSNADFTTVGRLLGSAALGAYTFGWTIASIPVDRVSALIGGVTPGIFAAVQHDHPALRRYLLRLTEGLALVTFPASVGLALVADEFVLIALGEKWRPAIVPLRLLALYGGYRSINALFSQIMVATGHSRRFMHFSLLSTAVMIPAFIIGAHWGVTGVAMGWIVGYPLVVFPIMSYTFGIIQLPLRPYLAALWPALSGSAAMAAAVLALRHLTPAAWPATLAFALHTVTGAATYAAVVWFFHGHRVRAFMGLLREVRR